MKPVPRGAALLPVLLVGWSAVFIGAVLPTATAAECTIEVSEDMMRPLLKTAAPSWTCDELWSNVLLHFQHTRQNLTECESRQEAVSTAERASYSQCQQMLDTMRDEMEDERRMKTREMEIRRQVAQNEIRQQQNEQQAMENKLKQMEAEWRPLYLELLQTSIGVGNVREALKYYHLYLEGHPPDALFGAILNWVYQHPKHENERLDNLLTFVRNLPTKAAKMTMYRLIKPEILKRQGQREGYLAAVAGLDAGRIVFDDNNEREYHLYTDLFDPVSLRWKNQVLAGKYEEVVAFATSHPMHFEEVETSYSTFKPDEWKKLNLNQFITFPNQLPLAKQRLEALLMILLQLQERNKTNYRDYLLKLAKEVDVCEAFVKKSRDSDTAQDKLAEVKRKFAEIDEANDYEYYLKESKKPPAQKSG